MSHSARRIKAWFVLLIGIVVVVQHSNGFLTVKEIQPPHPPTTKTAITITTTSTTTSKVVVTKTTSTRRTTPVSSSLLLASLSNNNNDNYNDNGISNSNNNNNDGNRKMDIKMGNLGEYDALEEIRREDVNVGDPQIKVIEKERSVNSILQELAAIQKQGPQKYCILGTRHCSFLHQDIIELLAYALVLSGNHVYTSGAGGTHAATIRGALRAEREDLLTVVLPQSMGKQPKESQELLKNVTDVMTMPLNDEMGLDTASRICNSYLLSQTDQLISFAFHESSTVIEATKEAKQLDMLVTVLYLD